MSVQDLINKAAELQNQSDVSSGGDFKYEIAPAGKTYARFVEYIELGSREQRAYQGQAKPDCREVKLTFELLSKKHMKEVEVNGEKVQINNKFSIILPIKLHEKAKFSKLFSKMKYGRDIAHMAQMLGEAFTLVLHHNESGEGDKKRTYVNLNARGGDYDVSAPREEDPDTGVFTEVPVPPATVDLKIFIWDNPTVESWTSLFIDGTRTRTVDGNEVEVSKNWLQEKILEAKDFSGSALESMLAGSQSLPDITQTAEVVELPEATEKPVTEASAAKESASEEDPLAALGLA